MGLTLSELKNVQCCVTPDVKFYNSIVWENQAKELRKKKIKQKVER